MRKQEKQAVTYSIRPELSKEAKTRKLENEARMRKRRDEGINSILISEVSEWHKKEFADEIKEQHKTSQAVASWRRLVKDRYSPSLDEVVEAQNDWWKTDALVAVANKGVKADNKQKRKRAIKDFFFIISGRRFLKRAKYNRQQKQELNSMVKDFLNYVPLKEHIRNDEEPLSANMYNFIHYILVYKQWRLVISPSSTYEIISKFKDQYEDEDAVMEHSPLTAKLLKDLYHFFRKKD